MDILGNLLSIFVNNIVPILAIAAVGYAFGSRLQPDISVFSRIVFYIFFPPWIFLLISRTEISGAEFLQFLGAIFLFFAFMTLISIFITRVTDVSFDSRANLILCAVAPNMGNYGLPLIEFAFGTDVATRATIVLVVGTIIYTVLGIYVASGTKFDPLQVLSRLSGVPLIYAAVLGIMANAMDFQLPDLLIRPVTSLGQAAIPSMLILLGIHLAKTRINAKLKPLIVGSTIRLFVAPIICIFCIFLIPINQPERIALVIQGSMPVAVTTIIISTEYQLDSELASSLVLLTTLISPITLSILIFILRGFG